MGEMAEDAMSEFSVLTTETDISPAENVLDLRISEIQFETSQLNRVLNLSETLPQAVQTFATVDFFINETKNTDLKTGYSPAFDTIFCFKNTVDDFYLKYLSQESMVVEVFAVKGSGKKQTEKIGEARLPLIILLQND